MAQILLSNNNNPIWFGKEVERRFYFRVVNKEVKYTHTKKKKKKSFFRNKTV